MRWNFQLSRKWRDRLNRWTGGTIEYIFYPYFMLVNAVSWVIQLLVRAWHTRHFRYLVHGFPALFALAGVIWAVVTVAIGQAQERRANLSKDYMGQVGEAWKSAASVTGTPLRCVR